MPAKKKDKETMGIKEAVKNLVSLMELENDHKENVINFFNVPQDTVKPEKIEHADWLKEEKVGENTSIIRQTFDVILHYLENERGVENKNSYSIEKIASLAQKAEKKWKGILKVFHKPEIEMKSVKELERFYKKHKIKKIEEKSLIQWIEKIKNPHKLKVSFSKKKLPDTSHVFIDLEAVKHDKEYELFYIKKENGNKYYYKSLLRQMRLVQEISHKSGEKNFLEELKNWKDLFFQRAAIDILDASKKSIERFLEEANNYKTRRSSQMVQMALMALTMAASSKNLLKEGNSKGCKGYFYDFHKFLRQLMKLDEYQKEGENSHKGSSPYLHAFYELINALCEAFFSKIQSFKSLTPFLLDAIKEQEGKRSKEHLKALDAVWKKLGLDYEVMKPCLKNQKGGSLKVTLETLEKREGAAFDPLFQGDIPSVLYPLYIKEKKSSHIRLASPIYQEYIHKAEIIEEFLAYLTVLRKGVFPHTHWFINFQDKTSWREFKRVDTLEHLSEVQGEKAVFSFTTLAKGTDFYHQTGQYAFESKTKAFIRSFKACLKDPKEGFYFSKSFQKILFSEWVETLFEAILKVFFEDRKELSLEERKDFIEISYLFIVLKGLEILQPDAFSFVSKDGIDESQSGSILFYLFLVLLKEKQVGEKDIELTEAILFIPSILIRERLMDETCFQRMLSALKKIEEIKTKKTFKKEIESLFKDLYTLKLKEICLD